MKTSPLLPMVTVLAFTIAASRAEAAAQKHLMAFLTGGEVYENCRINVGCISYLQGVADTVSVFEHIGMTQGQPRFWLCSKTPISGLTMRTIFMRFIETYPDERSTAAAPTVFAAMNAAFPCRHLGRRLPIN